MKNKLKSIITLVLIFTLVTPFSSYAKDEETIDKYSKASILIDQETGRILHSKNPDEKRPLASLSKMMTFLVAIESIKSGKVKPDDIVKIDKKAASVGGSSYKLKVNEEVKLLDLMKGLMIVSGNDAAVAIAQHISGDVDSFVKLMNKKAREIGMKNTHFINTNGLPIYDLSEPATPPKENISTVRDIAILGKYMMDHHEKEVVSITDMNTYSNAERGFVRNNTNALLRIYPDVDGIKTGYTGNAGYCLCFSMNVPDDNNDGKNFRLIGVTLGATKKEARMAASTAMLKYGRNNFETYKLEDKNELIGKRYIKGLDELEVILKTRDELWTIKGKDEIITSEIKINEINYPVKKGDVLGYMKYYGKDKELLGITDIISDNTVDKVPIKVRLEMLLNNSDN
jgi:D-alanyl-D-alanine carboxypeptidase